MRKNPRRILSPQRLPFRHPGNRHYKSSEHSHLLQHYGLSGYLFTGSGVRSGVTGALCRFKMRGV
jgi:hypothetical protein